MPMGSLKNVFSLLLLGWVVTFYWSACYSYAEVQNQYYDWALVKNVLFKTKQNLKRKKKSNNIRVHITSCFKIYLNYSRSKIQFSIGNHLMRATEITLCPQCKILSRFVCFWYSFLHLLHIYNTFELIFE